MEQYAIKGGNPLVGEVEIGGAKNAALPILAASVMTDETVYIENMPDVRDTNVLLSAMENIGVIVKRTDRHKVTLNASNISELVVEDENIKKIRASYYLIGALLGKYKHAEVALPGGGYLAFITGNLINMKIPCAMTARDMVDAKIGTPENEIISTISIATSSLVTIIVLAIGVLLMVPLQPVLQSPVLQPAFENVVPALFGAMAYKYYRKNMNIALFPLIIMSLLFTLVPSLIGSTSFMIVPSGAIAIGIAYLFYKKRKGGSK